MNRPNRTSLGILLATACGAAVWVAVATLLGPALIEAGWRGESVGWVNAAFEGRDRIPLEEYLGDWRRLWLGLLANWLAFGALVAVLARPETWTFAKRAFGSSPAEIFRAAPKLTIGVVAVSLAVTEWYPLSQFPMYSTFAREGGYVFVTDANDEPLATQALGGIRPDAIEKIFSTNLRQERERRGVVSYRWYLGGPHPKSEAVQAAALQTLLYLRDQRFRTEGSLRLWRTRIVLGDGEIRRERELLAEVPAE